MTVRRSSRMVKKRKGPTSLVAAAITRRAKSPPARVRPAKARQRRNGPHSGRLDWTTLSDRQLLNLQLSDLGLKIEGTALERRIEQLYKELEQRGLRFRPHCWL